MQRQATNRRARLGFHTLLARRRSAPMGDGEPAGCVQKLTHDLVARRILERVLDAECIRLMTQTALDLGKKFSRAPRDALNGCRFFRAGVSANQRRLAGAQVAVAQFETEWDTF